MGGGGGGALLVEGAAGGIVGLPTGIGGGRRLARLFSVGEIGKRGRVGLSIDILFGGREDVGNGGGGPREGRSVVVLSGISSSASEPSLSDICCVGGGGGAGRAMQISVQMSRSCPRHHHHKNCPNFSF